MLMGKYMARGIALSLPIFFGIFLVWRAFAALPLSFVSDTITDSAPSVPANHIIAFKTRQAVPASGSILLVPDAPFTVPSAFDYTDVDLATAGSSTGPFTDRDLTATAGAASDGVSAVAGTGGSITIALDSTAGIGANQSIKINLGTNATFGAQGADAILNPASTTSYRIKIFTRNASGGLLDEGTAMVAIVPPVGIEANTFDFFPPVISNPLPAGTLPGGTKNVEISLNTDEPAFCRYAITPGVAYGAMTNIITDSLSTFHSIVITGLTDNATSTFYIRCSDRIPNVNPADFPLSFFIAAALPPPADGTGNSPPPSGGGGGGGGGGSGAPFPAGLSLPQITLSGRAYPSSPVSILIDGNLYQQIQADQSGIFSLLIPEVSQGVHTFGLYAIDADNKKSALYTSTLTLISGTKNAVSGILIPPTAVMPKNTVDPGEAAQISGLGVPLADMEVSIIPQSAGVLVKPIVKTTKADAAGAWAFSLDTTGLAKDTYVIKVRSLVDGFGVSNYSEPLYLGVGLAPVVPAAGSFDLNSDGRVNLVDFSILLFNWGTTGPAGDLNGDHKVNLTDLSILLFHWTG